MSQPRIELIKIIKYYQLDYRFPHWYEHLFMAEQGLYPDSFCNILLDDARRDAEEVEKSGNWLDRPPTEELHKDGKPDIILGKAVETDIEFGISTPKPKNILTVGGTGSGKTVCTRSICSQVIHSENTEAHLIIIDIKPDYLGLVNESPEDVVVYSAVNGLRFGLNGPENVAPYIWIGHVSLSICGRIGLLMARMGLTSMIVALLLIMNHGLKKQDLKDPSVSKHLTWPSLEMVLKIAQNKKLADAFFSKATYVQSFIQALGGLLQDAGDLFDCNNGLNIDDVIKQKHIILNVSTLPDYVTHIITDICISQVLVSRMASAYKTEKTEIIYVLDECDLLLESDVKNFSGLSCLDRLHRLGREMGLCSIVSISGM